MMRLRLGLSAAVLSLAVAMSTGPALAVPCGDFFDAWLDGFKREAAGKGISQRALAALSGVTPERAGARARPPPGPFPPRASSSSACRASTQRIGKAQRLMQQHAGLLSRIEQQFGVPGAVVIAIWGLETDFGVNHGQALGVALARDARA